jgi:hypothetical protein
LLSDVTREILVVSTRELNNAASNGVRRFAVATIAPFIVFTHAYRKNNLVTGLQQPLKYSGNRLNPFTVGFISKKTSKSTKHSCNYKK